MMSFKTAVKVCAKKCFKASGRATRAEFWWLVLALFIALVVLSVPFIILLGPEGMIQLMYLESFYFLMAMTILVFAAVRRLHDAGRTGAWLLLVFVPLVRLGLLYFLCEDSEPCDNRYGEYVEY